ncbi:hypothetical protein PYW07_004366 [Mythimna separata]|uniref:G-protein coupled receptors family 2 profile 2 domain-containing protein n=1 Tax=Mythimna separata TaxID=271217 RepID=A0AAD8DYT3_MYTSE|nr:hypothetical protein PYW07_004366 [Mythimna separata]
MGTRAASEKYVISENGSVEIQEDSGTKSTVEKLNYCIDRSVDRIQKDPLLFKVKTVLRQITADSTDRKKIRQLENIGLMISSFFLVCVLIVYSLLPDLRNLTGLILMAYMLTLLLGFITKFILDYILSLPKTPDHTCKIMTPIVYFGFVSSIFWLSVYAFDVFWGLRGFRIQRNSKNSKMVKFMWYALYAWGTPLLLTTIIVVLDNLPSLKLAVPTPFKDCLNTGISLDYYYKIPIGILTLMNIVLFILTVYNIWMVKHAVNRCHDSGRSKQQSNRFATYAKLFLMMGVGWCMELFPPGDDVWIYVLLNLYNLLTGVTIFYLFICKRIILLQLCRKFNVPNDFIKYWGLDLSHTRTESGITRSTGVSSTIRRRSKDQTEDIGFEKLA